MKHCPTCKTNYADDTLQYCLEDGTPLVGLQDSQAPTVALSETEAETVVRGSEPAQTRAAVPPTQVWQEPQSQVTQVPPQFQFQAPPQSPPKKSNTALAVAATALVMLILFGGILGGWLLYKNSQKSNANKVDININPPGSPTTSPSVSITPSPTPTGTITPTVNATPTFDVEQAKSDVRNRMNLWKSSMESGSLDAVMSHYASRLDYYYRSGSTSSDSVRQNKKRAFELYNSFRVTMTNMDISLNDTGDRATVTFTKSWDFRGSTDDSKGSVRAQFQVSKIGTMWYITGEKDL